MKSVYLIKQKQTNLYKIGYSTNPNTRIKQLQTGCHEKLELVDFFETDFYSQIERALHNTNSHLKVHGEWFEFDLLHAIINSFQDVCKRIENNLLTLKNNKI